MDPTGEIARSGQVDWPIGIVRVRGRNRRESQAAGVDAIHELGESANRVDGTKSVDLMEDGRLNAVERVNESGERLKAGGWSESASLGWLLVGMPVRTTTTKKHWVQTVCCATATIGVNPAFEQVSKMEPGPMGGTSSNKRGDTGCREWAGIWKKQPTPRSVGTRCERDCIRLQLKEGCSVRLRESLMKSFGRRCEIVNVDGRKVWPDGGCEGGE